MQNTTPATQPKTSYLVEVYFPTSGKRTTFRWPTRRQANRCAKDFAPLPGQTAQQGPCLIVAHQPTWGLDIGAVAYVQQQLLAARDAGAAVLLITDDLDEAMALGDRIAVMHHGHLSPAHPSSHWSRDSIGLAMAGGTVTAQASEAS